MNQCLEVWKPVLGWESIYYVSSFGRVKSLKRKVVHKNGFIQTIPDKILNGSIATNGYRHVDLRRPGSRKNIPVHRLVLDAFVGFKKNGYESLHKDGNKLNNSLANLRYGTRADNIADSIKHRSIPSGERHWNVKLSDLQVIDIYYSNRKTQDLANEYNVSFAAIHDIRNGRRRKLPQMRSLKKQMGPDEINKVTDQFLKFG